MRVAELDGALLDYWVARAEDLPKPRVDDSFCWIEEPACDGDPAGALDAAFAPSADWAQCGPIIERAEIRIAPSGTTEANRWSGAVALPGKPGEFAEQHGATPLIAALRAFVASHFGEDVSDEHVGM
jgi:Protein of unknown function (DUF2591)